MFLQIHMPEARVLQIKDTVHDNSCEKNVCHNILTDPYGRSTCFANKKYRT